LQLARALTAPTASLDWHLVRIGPAGELLANGMDVLTIAPSLARAFAGLQIEMDRERVFPDEVRWTEQGIAFLARGGGLLASIEPVPVEAPDLQRRERVNDLMKGLRIYGDEENPDLPFRFEAVRYGRCRITFVKSYDNRVPARNAIDDSASHAGCEPKDPRAPGRGISAVPHTPLRWRPTSNPKHRAALTPRMRRET
jgi:hypothetical protein